jgi:hypothetical protein
MERPPRIRIWISNFLLTFTCLNVIPHTLRADQFTVTAVGTISGFSGYPDGSSSTPSPFLDSSVQLGTPFVFSFSCDPLAQFENFRVEPDYTSANWALPGGVSGWSATFGDYSLHSTSDSTASLQVLNQDETYGTGRDLTEYLSWGSVCGGIFPFTSTLSVGLQAAAQWATDPYPGTGVVPSPTDAWRMAAFDPLFGFYLGVTDVSDPSHSFGLNGSITSFTVSMAPEPNSACVLIIACTLAVSARFPRHRAHDPAGGARLQGDGSRPDSKP